jgi:phosphoglycerate dehydrogenase-like enzyme
LFFFIGKRHRFYLPGKRRHLVSKIIVPAFFGEVNKIFPCFDRNGSTPIELSAMTCQSENCRSGYACIISFYGNIIEMMKAIFMSNGNKEILERVYSPEARKILTGKIVFLDPLTNMEEIEKRRDELSEVSFIFSTWGMPALSEGQIEEFFPALKAVFYAAGSVQGFAVPFLSRGIRIFSAADANAVPVIEFTTAQIILANKGFFGSAFWYGAGEYAEARRYFGAFPGNFGARLGIIGAGKIGRGVIAKLKDYRLDVSVFDPFLDGKEAAVLGVKKCETLEDLFSSCFVISNHLANNKQTENMIQYKHFSLMDDYGVFINTGRGQQLIEKDLVRAFTEKPGRTALLDVTWPEPVEKDHPFFTMKNIILTPHIAGSAGKEVARMGDYMADEFERFLDGRPLKYEVSAAMLATMA